MNPPKHEFKSKNIIDEKNFQKLKSILDKILFRKDSIIFHEPVDYIGLNLTDYLRIIQRPMDLGTVKKNLENRAYQFVEQCLNDIQLTYANCMLYNSGDSYYFNTAKKLEEFTKKQTDTTFGNLITYTDDSQSQPNAKIVSE